MRWLAYPVLFVIMCWILYISPELIQKIWIRPIMFDDVHGKENEPKVVEPVIPKNMLDAYDMGVIID
jgi:hypothetical protein